MTTSDVRINAEFIIDVLSNERLEQSGAVQAARARIRAHYVELKGTSGFLELSRQARVEWLTAYLAETVKASERVQPQRRPEGQTHEQKS